MTGDGVDDGDEESLPPDREAGRGPAPGTEDDLDGYETSMSRLVARARSWLALFIAAVLVVPLGGWLVQELAFQRSGSDVEEQLGETGLADSVLLVRSARCDAGGGSGSGFVARRDGRLVVVTNRHVVENARVVSVRPLTGGVARDVVSYRLSDDADVAVLEIGDPSWLPPALPFGDPAREGETIRVVGFPAARPFTTAGEVTDVEPHRLLLDVRTDPGASGSPVVDEDGRVVGQVFARTAEGRGVATAVGTLTDAIGSARAVDPPC